MKLSQSTVRAAALTGFPALCRSVGLNPVRLLRDAGLDIDVEHQPDRRLPGPVVHGLLETAARQAGIDDFGLRLASLRGFSNLGPVTVLARDEPDMRSALRVFTSFLPLHNEAMDISLTEEDETAILACRIAGSGPGSQAVDLAIGMLFRILRELLGADWTPELVCLERSAPAQRDVFHRTFGRRVSFDESFSGILFAATDLDRPNVLAQADLRRYTAPLADRWGGGQQDPLPVRVRRLIAAMIAHRRCTAPSVAQQLGLSRRTLDRRLADEGTSFQTLLEDVRRDVARGQIEGTARSMTEIALMTGFGSPAAFNSWFSGAFGMPPARWRKLGRTAPR